MKKLLLALAFAGAACSGAPAMSASDPAPAAAGAGSGKSVFIGVFDLNRVNNDAKVMKSLSRQRDKELDKIKAELEDKRKEFEKREGDLRAKQVVMSADAFGRDVAQFQKEVREAEMALQKKGEAIERSFIEVLRKLQNDYMDGIYRQVGNRHGFDMLLTNQSAYLLNSKLDVTDEIIKTLDEKIKDMKFEVK